MRYFLIIIVVLLSTMPLQAQESESCLRFYMGPSYDGFIDPVSGDAWSVFLNITRSGMEPENTPSYSSTEITKTYTHENYRAVLRKSSPYDNRWREARLFQGESVFWHGEFVYDFSWHDHTAVAVMAHEMTLIDMQNNTITTIPLEIEGQIELSFDGRYLVASKPYQNAALYSVAALLDGDTQPIHTITFDDPVVIRWSPNSRYFAIIQDTASQVQANIVDVEGRLVASIPDILVAGSFWTWYQIRWSPDGQHLLYLKGHSPFEINKSVLENPASLIKLNVETGEKLVISRSVISPLAFSFASMDDYDLDSPETERIVYQYLNNEQQITAAMIDTSGENNVVLVDNAEIPAFPYWQPDGKSVVIPAVYGEKGSRFIVNQFDSLEPTQWDLPYRSLDNVLYLDNRAYYIGDQSVLESLDLRTGERTLFAQYEEITGFLIRENQIITSWKDDNHQPGIDVYSFDGQQRYHFTGIGNLQYWHQIYPASSGDRALLVGDDIQFLTATGGRVIHPDPEDGYYLIYKVIWSPDERYVAMLYRSDRHAFLDIISDEGELLHTLDIISYPYVNLRWDKCLRPLIRFP